MDVELLEHLLHVPEGMIHDYKREQYRLTDDREKGELIKDILAFANSARERDAHIMIGVEEQPGRRGIVHGVTHHLSESNLQQLVNFKTNRKIRFTYIPVEIDGKDVGVIKIDAGQRRPFFFTKDFGLQKRWNVPVRHGSSTDMADPDEVADMREADSAEKPPSVRLALTNEDGKPLGPGIWLVSHRLIPYGDREVDKLREKILGSLSAIHGTPEAWRAYRETKARLSKVRFWFENTGGVDAEDLRATIRFPADDRLLVMSKPPRAPMMGGIYHSELPSVFSDVQVSEEAGHREVTCFVKHLRPHEKREVTDPFYLGATEDIEIEVTALILGKRITPPIEVPLQFSIRRSDSHIPLNQLEHTGRMPDEAEDGVY